MAGFTISESGFNNVTNGLDFYDDFSDNASVSSQSFSFTDVENFPVDSYGYVRQVLWKIVAPIIILSGTVGNLLTILVFLKSGLSGSSTAIYLSTLALSDTLLLWCAPFGTWLRYAWSVDMQALGEYGCRARLFASSTCLHFSSWVLVAVTMERTISVVVPHKAKLYCRPKIAGIVIAVIFVLLTGCDLAVLLLGSVKGYSLFNENKELQCAATTIQDTLVHSSHNIIGWVDLLVSYSIPFVFLLVGNIIIIGEIHRSRKTRASMRIARSPRATRSSYKSTWSLTVLMIILCIVFLLTMTPVSVFHVYCPMQYSKILELMKTDVVSAWDSYQYLLLQRTIVNLVSYTNASFNFVLYVLSGSMFREQLKSICCCEERRNRMVLDRSVFSEINSDCSVSKSRGENVKIYITTRTKSMAKFQQTNKWKEEFLIKRSEQKDAIEQSNIAFMDDYGSSISSILSTAQETFHSDEVDETLNSTVEPIQASENEIYNKTSNIDSVTAKYSDDGSKEAELSGFLLWI